MMDNSQMGNMFDLESQSFSVFDPTASPAQNNGDNIVASNGGVGDQATVTLMSQGAAARWRPLLAHKYAPLSTT